jgi:colicin import membrane protein
MMTLVRPLTLNTKAGTQSKKPWLYALGVHGLFVLGMMFSLQMHQKVEPVSVELWSELPSSPAKTVVEPPVSTKVVEVPPVEPPVVVEPPKVEIKPDIVVEQIKPEKKKKVEKVVPVEKVVEKVEKPKKKVLKLNEIDTGEPVKVTKKPTVDMSDLLGQANSNNNSNTATSNTGRQSRGGKASKEYMGILQQLIRSNVTGYKHPPDAGNPMAEVDVELLPTGEVLKAVLTKSSGLPKYDEAVLKAVHRAAPYPKQEDNTVPKSLQLKFKPTDLF